MIGFELPLAGLAAPHKGQPESQNAWNDIRFMVGKDSFIIFIRFPWSYYSYLVKS